MLFLIFWLLGFKYMVSTATSLTSIALTVFGFPAVYNIIIVGLYLAFDLIIIGVTRRSEMFHHIFGLLSIYYLLFCKPEYIQVTSQVLTFLECSTVLMNFYHDSKSDKPETVIITNLLSTKTWSYLFVTSFIIFRFILFELYTFPYLGNTDFAIFHHVWLGLNTYWIFWMLKKFVFTKPISVDK
jgi:hypothetical protein